MKTGFAAMSISLSSALRSLPDLNAKTLARAFLVSDDCGYDVIAGSWDERFEKLAHGLATLPAPAADAVLSALLRGTPYQMPARADVDPDVNDDGRIDGNDVRDGLLRLAKESLVELERALCDGLLRPAEKAELLTHSLNGFERLIDQVRAANAQSAARPVLRAAGA